MPAVVFSERALSDLDRVTDFLVDSGMANANVAAGLIVQAVRILATHPMIGRTVDMEHRELMISQGRTGYIALYEYQSTRDRVLIHAIKHQREAGFDE